MKGIVIFNSLQFHTIHSKTCNNSFIKTHHNNTSYECPICNAEYENENCQFVGILPVTKNNVNICKTTPRTSDHFIIQIEADLKGNIISEIPLN